MSYDESEHNYQKYKRISSRDRFTSLIQKLVDKKVMVKWVQNYGLINWYANLDKAKEKRHG